MGVASSFFEPQPCNFGKLDIFLRCSNDISIIFWISYSFQTYKKALEPSSPDESKNSLHRYITPWVWKNNNLVLPLQLDTLECDGQTNNCYDRQTSVTDKQMLSV